MVTPEEKEEIISAAVEKALLMLPTVMGNLLQEKAAQKVMVDKFYKDHPEFMDDERDPNKWKQAIVAAEIMKFDGENPGMSWAEVLKKAEPEIRRRIQMGAKLDTSTIRKPEKYQLEYGDRQNDHGAL